MRNFTKMILSKGDKVLIWLCIVLSISLIATQVLMISSDYVGKFNFNKRLEGTKIIKEQVIKSVGNIGMKNNVIEVSLDMPYITSLPLANILVNGQKVSDFTYTENCIKVKSGDKVKIDISPYLLDLTFRIKASKNLKMPEKKLKVTKKGSLTFAIP